MAKYTFEQKKKVVQEYLDGKGSFESVAKQNNIPHGKQVREWVKAYEKFGEEGLFRSKKKKNYSLQFKLSVVQLYLTSKVSYQELALSQGMNNPSLITRWVQDFRSAGPDALRSKEKGHEKKLDTKQNKKAKNTSKPTKTTAVDTDGKRLKALEDENLKLRIEVAYLKELRRLCLEEETLLKKKRESSTVSEESSN